MDDLRPATELALEALRRRADPASLGFATTQDLPAPTQLVGQRRAQEAISLALEIADPRYNLYVAGDPGVGRMGIVLRAVGEAAQARSAQHDWVYVHHFDQPEEPLAIALPVGKGAAFAHDLDMYVLACRRELRRAFAADIYDKQRADLLRDIDTQHSALLDDLQNQALSRGFVIQGTPSGLAILPIKAAEGAAAPTADHLESVVTLTPEEFNALPEADRQRLQVAHEETQAAIARTLPQAHALEELARQRVRALDHDVAVHAVSRLTDLVTPSYADSPAAVAFVQRLCADIVAHADVLRGEPSDPGQSQGAPTDVSQSGQVDAANPANQGAAALGANGEDSADGGDPTSADDPDSSLNGALGGVPLDEDLRDRPALAALLRRYRVNPIITRPAGEQAPVVQETNPTYVNLLGRIEFGVRDGLPYTDHMMIKAGALHRANGGFLIVQARDVVTAGRSWDAIKRMLRFGEITMESGVDSPGTPPSATLRPQPIRADVKVILIGDRETYAALAELDPEFRQLFKVRADFDTDMPRTAEAEQAYAQVAGEVARAQGAPALTSDAVAALIEEGSRWAEDQQRLSTLMVNVSDLATEACYWAKKAGAATTTGQHVTQAITSREYRLSLASEKYDDMIAQGELMIATDGEVVGQVNGLTIITSGGHEFGKPTRITARVSPGLAGVTSIERETAMSGPSHSKGVLALSGYLAGKFAQDFPLALSASLCFEQVYDGVDGDSASSSELYALLSALANVPIKQAFAVTGSVNQRGEVQAIGGVTHKIEGFFNICQARGLTGRQGVIIPRANVRSLMLRDEVVVAVGAGQFHIHAISTIDEGIALLTGIPAGHADPQGRYLEGTIAARVSQTLRVYSERVRAYMAVGAYARNKG